MSKTEFKLIGLSVVTNNLNERSPELSKIFKLVNFYFGSNMAAKIPHRLAPGATISASTHYESNKYGNYVYFIGEEVSSFENVPTEFQTAIIPANQCQRFTTYSGKMTEAVLQAWRVIWQLPNRLNEKPAYQADFRYDGYADTGNAMLDVFAGLATY